MVPDKRTAILEISFPDTLNNIITVKGETNLPEAKNQILKLLASKGIQTSVHYIPVHKFGIYSAYKKNLPKTEYVGDNLITLPMYSSLTVEKIKYICDSIKEVLNKN